MGFYGNITNTAKTQFSFDKIYPNRKAMDLGAASADGVYVGRYVLIEYDGDIHQDTFPRVVFKNGNAYLHSNTGILVTRGMVKKNDIVYSGDVDSASHVVLNSKFYRCTSEAGSTAAEKQQAATFEEILISSDNQTNYTRNYHIDLSVYSGGRGYDSTVWQKVYTNGAEKYVMIAELNTVVPTFDIAPDPPTMNPIAPHFDIASTDVYYKLHQQAPWGFRVGQASSASVSDGTTTWKTVEYNPETGLVENKETKTVNAAIYFNKAGFNERTPNIASGSDSITITQASSGLPIYNDHNNPGKTIAAEDIQELKINLPSIGNTISKVWDIVHGDDRKDSTGDIHPSLQGRLNAFSEMKDNTIAVKRSNDGTLVGTRINGNEARDVGKGEILTQELHISDFAQDDAWIKTSINTNDLNNNNNLNGIAIHHTFHSVDNTTTNSDKNTSEGNGNNKGQGHTLELYTPYVDAAGHVVGHNIETVTLPFGFKTITTNGVNEENVSNPEITNNVNIIADNTQDSIAINSANKWIRIANNSNADSMTIGHEVHSIVTESKSETNLNTELNANNESNINIPDWDYDEAGHITHKQDHKYTLPFGFKTVHIGNARSEEVSENATSLPAAADVIADSTQDILTINSGNKWIRLDTDEINNSITLRHDVHNVVETNDVTDWSITASETDISIPVQTCQFDEAGHYISSHTESYQLPFGYGKIIDDKNGATAASSTYDELKFTTDKYLSADVTQDTITITHQYPSEIADTFSETNLNTTEEKNSIVLETLVHDDAGHIVNVNYNTVTLPYGYKTFKDSNDDVGSSSADNTQDIFYFKGDSWIRPTVSTDQSLFEHMDPVAINYTPKPNEELKFGDHFTIDDYYYDSKGHVFKHKSHTVQIPQGSLIDNVDSGNIITQLSFTQETGQLQTSRSNIADIKLEGYAKKSISDNISKDDSLGDALSKLQTQVNGQQNFTQEINTNLTNTSTIVEEHDQILLELIGKVEDNTKNLNNEISRAQTNEGALRESINEVELSIANLLAQDLQTIEEIHTLNSRCNVLDKEVKNNINVNTQQGEKISILDSNIENINLSLKDIKAINATQSQDIDTLNSRCNVLDKEVKNNINVNTQQEEKIIALEAKCQELAELVASLTLQVSQLQEQLINPIQE